MKQIVKDIVTLQLVPCHRKKERSMVIKGKQLPLCYRCMTILLGYFAIPILLIYQIYLPLWIGVILNIPMVLDGYTQLKGWRMSNNFLRSLTGILSGFGQAVIVTTSVYYVVEFILYLSAKIG